MVGAGDKPGGHHGTAMVRVATAVLAVLLSLARRDVESRDGFAIRMYDGAGVSDPDGKVLGFVETPPGMLICEIGEDHIPGRVRDELDVELIQVWPLAREQWLIEANRACFSRVAGPPPHRSRGYPRTAGLEALARSSRARASSIDKDPQRLELSCSSPE